MKVHLIDGTYELFRSYFGAPKALYNGAEVGATRGIIRSLHALLREPDVTHVAVAFDTVIESFRNDLFDGYKTSFGVPDDLMSQFPLAERATEALGMVTWRMIEFEADDALATFAARAAADPVVDQVVIASPDKDLRQCVRGSRVVCLDRLRKVVIDEAGVIEKFGIPPTSIPDWLALVGDDADGIPGVTRWGARSAAQVLAHYGHIEAIPDAASKWQIRVRGAEVLAESLRNHRIEVALYRTLASLREDVPLTETLEDLEWRGARRDELAALCAEIGDMEFLDRVERWR
jgi:5'-3' exonuclease